MKIELRDGTTITIDKRDSGNVDARDAMIGQYVGYRERQGGKVVTSYLARRVIGGRVGRIRFGNGDHTDFRRKNLVAQAKITGPKLARMSKCCNKWGGTLCKYKGRIVPDAYGSSPQEVCYKLLVTSDIKPTQQAVGELMKQAYRLIA